MDLVNKFWNFCHTLRHEGVDYIDYIEELTYLLFLKIADEREIEIPKGCSWNDLIIYEEEDLLKRYNSILSELSREKSILGDIFSQPMAKIRNASSLKKLLNLIDEVNWSEFDKDVLGAMFEGLLEKAANESKKGAGQYFTPRPLIEAIIRVMKPDPLESPNFKISDVACGTAGFIISSFEWWKKNSSLKLSKVQKEKVFAKTYFGQELVVRPRRMAQMNLYLHGIEPNIRLGDTIYEPLSDERFSCILTNPPFGSKGSNQLPDRSDFLVKTSNKQLNFVQHVISSLEDKGRAAIVLPDNVLFEDKAIELWRHAMKFCNVHTILRLPNGTFTPYAQGVKANVIFLQKGLPTENVWIFDARNNIEGITKIDRPLNRSHFDEFEANYGQDPNGLSPRKGQGIDGRFRKFSIKEIKEQNYRLDFTWLIDKSSENNFEEISSEEIVTEAINKIKGMLLDLEDVLSQIEK
ncbi:class I SAM-dependent DNA methyltransferase [Pedobacter frigoris]|uniref:site-specific DNA-methyltransferase (adenine-specific) n=1 Tax=Pedobacter frigoris TaxID=2571272 RepID=A0A4U1CJ16_9SPHI|nr:N-6 DNA methylase [Pedobacter frigoris]TKC04866.1 SAM-dependent DNA methyltransferase [Pedobacter frigoris]